MYRAIIRWRNEAFIQSIFERADWFIILAHANYVYIQHASSNSMLPTPAAPLPMIPIPVLLLGVGGADANIITLNLLLQLSENFKSSCLHS